MNQKWVSVVGVVVVLGLAYLFSNWFSGTPASVPVSAPEPVKTDLPKPKQEIDFVTDVALNDVSARVSELKEGDMIIRGVEYDVKVAIPNRLTFADKLGRMMIGVDFTGKTKEVMGTRRIEPLVISTSVNPTHTVYSVHVATIFSNMHEKADLEHLVAHGGDELQISLWVDGKQVKDLN